MTLEQIQDVDFKVGDKFLYEYRIAEHSIILCIGCIHSIDIDEIRFIDLDAVDINYIGTETMAFDDIFINTDNIILIKLQVPSLLDLAQQTHPEYFV